VALPEKGIELLVRSVRPTNAYEETMQRLLQSIRLGLIGTGEKLPAERELASMLKVSRDTVREAISTLSEAGYLSSRRGRYGGTFVAETLPNATIAARAQPLLTTSELDDIATLRRVLEVGAAREAAARNLSATERSSLVSALSDCDAAGGDDYRRRDSRFHLVIAELSGSSLLIPLVANVRTRVNELLDSIPMLKPNIAHSNDQHAQIVSAILGGQADAAAAATLAHLEGTDALLSGFLASNPQR